MSIASSDRRLLPLLLFILFLGLTDVQVIPAILSLLKQEFSVSFSWVGTVVTAYAVAGAVWAMIVGPLSDRIGRLIFVRAALVLFVLSSMMAFITIHFEIYLLARVLSGLSGGVFSACIIAQVADMFPFKKRGHAMGGVAATYSLSMIVGVPGGAFLANRFGWRAIYLIFAGLALVLALSLQHEKGVFSLVREHGSPTRNKIAGEIRQQVLQYLGFWGQKSTRQGLLLAIFVAATSTALITYLGAWLVQDFSMSVNQVGVVFLITGAAMVAGSVFGGWISDRIGKQQLFGLSSLVLAFFMIWPAWLASAGQVYLFCILGGLAISLREGPYQAIITELVPALERGAYVAMRSTTSKLAIAGTAALAGILFEKQSFAAVAGLAGFCSLCAAAINYFGIRPAMGKTREKQSMEGK